MWKFGDAITAPTSPKIKYNVFVLEGRYRDLIPVCIGEKEIRGDAPCRKFFMSLLGLYLLCRE